MFRRIAILIYMFRWPIGLALLLMTIILGMPILHLQIDPSMEPLFIKNSPEYLYYRQYNEKYGSDQMIAVAMATSNIFRAQNLDQMRAITEELAKFPNVERVLSLANAMDIRSKFIGVKVVPALGDYFKGDQSPEQLRGQILSNELYVNNLISKDGRVANILVYLKSTGKDANSNGTFIENLRKYLAERQRPGLQFYVAGAPVEQYDFIRLIRRDQFTFVPLIAILLVSSTFLIYRSLACMILSMSIVFMTLLWTLGTIAILGKPLNLMTSLLAPVIMIVAVINSVYLINVFFEVRPHHPSMKSAVVMTMQQLGLPCFLTHFTTILGFISLALSHIPAIKSFGTFAALGTFYSYIVELTLTPILFPLLPYRYVGQPSDKRSVLNHVLVEFIEKLDLRWKWWILALTVVTVIVSYKGLSKIEIDTNIIKQMKPNLPLAVSTRFIDEHLTGVYSLGFVLRRKDGGIMTDYDTLRRIDEFKDFLESRPEISKVNGITTLIKRIHQAREGDKPQFFILSENQEDLDRYFAGILKSSDSDVERFISRDMREIRLEARMRSVGTTQGARLEELTREYMKDRMGQYFEYDITGNVVLLGKIAKGLVHEQIRSFGFALASILILIIIFFRSVPLGLLAAIPNLIPILAVYGLMGYAKIELSTPTAMISSIVLGMVVDASIQFLYRFRLEFQHRRHYLQALHHTCRNMGQSMFVSTMILSIGFASSAFASFRPTIHFGTLTSLTIFLAFICTLVVLPVCIIVIKPFGSQRLFHRRRRGDSSRGDFSIQEKM